MFQSTVQSIVQSTVQSGVQSPGFAVTPTSNEGFEIAPTLMFTTVLLINYDKIN
jgi:hypothetical protein